MPYTYDDFTYNLPNAGLTEADFSAEDLALAKSNPDAGMKLLEAKSDWKNAKTDDERAMANATANQVRSQAGYSGGIDGVNGNASLTPDDLPGYVAPQSSAVPQTSMSADDIYGAGGGVQNTRPAYQYTPPVQTSQPAYQYQAPVQNVQPYMEGYTDPYQTTGTPGDYQSAPAPAPFSYDKPAPTYQSTGTYNNQYDAQQKQMLGDITNYKDFTFDAETNPQMQAYTKQYHREGNRAMQDTMGAMAGMTGGMPSTAAISAAQQANNYYMSQLGDKLPEVYQAEYNKYLQEFNMLQDKYGAVNQAEQIDYSRYWDGENFNWEKFLSEQGQYNTDRGQAFNEYQSDLGQYNTDRQFGYGQTVDDLTYKTDANNTAYNRAYNADTTQYGRGRDSVNDQNYAQEQYRLANESEYGRGRDVIGDQQFNSEQQRILDEAQYQRGRDTIGDEQFNTEQQRIAEQDAFDRKYKIDSLNADAKETEYNAAVDRFEMMTYADQKTADYFGIEKNTPWGGEASLLEIEKKKAEIENINRDTANIGKSTGSSGGSNYGEMTDQAVIDAYVRIENGQGTAEDRALLAREKIELPKAKTTTGETDDMPTDAAQSSAIGRLDSKSATAADLLTLHKAGYTDDDITSTYPYVKSTQAWADYRKLKNDYKASGYGAAE